MTELSKQTCQACQKGAPTLTDAETQAALAELPEWQLAEVDGVKRLVRLFAFKDFRDALAFTNRVGELAESESHHPQLVLEWGSVEVSWWTHKIHGVHHNDAIMAAKTDALYS